MFFGKFNLLEVFIVGQFLHKIFLFFRILMFYIIFVKKINFPVNVFLKDENL